jgi:hypothetical protein
MTSPGMDFRFEVFKRDLQEYMRKTLPLEISNCDLMVAYLLYPAIKRSLLNAESGEFWRRLIHEIKTEGKIFNESENKTSRARLAV